MNKRIKKKKEKQSLLEYSFEIAPECPFKRRKEIVNNQWKIYSNSEIRLKIGYKRRCK